MKTEVYELNTTAEVGKLAEVLEFIDGLLEKSNCPVKAQTRIDVAVDELFGNIAHYAYPDGVGEATVRVTITEQYAQICFIDSGIPYNPLEKEDPDVTLGVKERKIGGLGIFLTKKLMDDITYEYSGGKNIVTIKKNF